jgi:hypothetical protein
VVDIHAGIPALPPQFASKVTDAPQRHLGDAAGVVGHRSGVRP